MRVDRRTFILSALVAAAACRRGRSGEADSELARAAGWLWAQQGEDGGFHSTTYGLLASGQSLTPFALNALLDVPESITPRPAGGVDRAVEFILRHTNDDGILGLSDDAATDYPNYATAMAVRALLRADHHGEVEQMTAALRRQQFSEDHGWKEPDAPYGGWGMGGAIRRPPQAGHVDLSMTRTVLEALATAGVGPADPVMARARVYIERSRNADGGFFFSTVNPQTNKAGGADGNFASYGTATADGLLALRAAGVPETDERVLGAIRWLEDHHTRDRAPGLDEGPYEGWDQGLRFYYGGVISRAVPELDIALPEQDADGAYRNPSNLVKEDDPLVATPLALEVLVNREFRLTLPGV
jgi:hypothetical protein